MNKQSFFLFCVELIAILAIFTVGALKFPACHKLMFEWGGVILIIIIAVWAFFLQNPPSSPPDKDMFND